LLKQITTVGFVNMTTPQNVRDADYNIGHPASLPTSSNLTLSEPISFEDPEYFQNVSSLNAQEIDHFKREGFLVKRGLINDKAVFRQISDHIWGNVPRHLINREKPATWVDPPEDQWTEEDSLRVGNLAGNSWKIRSKGPNGLGTEKFLVDRIANSVDVREAVKNLIGGPVQRARRVRGIYCVFPSKVGAENRCNVHVDYMASHLAAMVIAADIGPRCGGFMLWPGSHLELHKYWSTVHGGGMDPDQTTNFLGAREKIIREVIPVEFTGSAGDVIFWHPRALHSAGINRSIESGKPIVRVIIPCDFQRDGRTYVDDEQFGPGDDYQWWIDARNFEEDDAPTPNNMWDDWAI
jgi:hypothetical protein